jgi:hypothetical protein
VANRVRRPLSMALMSASAVCDMAKPIRTR